MSDFKQQVEELCLQYLTLCKCRDDYSPAMVEPELTEAILALHNARLDEIAEGMQPLARKFKRNSNCWGYDFSDEYEAGAEKQLDECQAYIQAQKEG